MLGSSGVVRSIEKSFENDWENANSLAHEVVHLVELAHLQRWRGLEWNGEVSLDRTLVTKWPDAGSTHPVSAACERLVDLRRPDASRVRSRVTGCVKISSLVLIIDETLGLILCLSVDLAKIVWSKIRSQGDHGGCMEMIQKMIKCLGLKKEER